MEKVETGKWTWKNSFQIWSSNLDLDELKFQIKNTFNSPNPWSLYANAKKFKEQISWFINQLTNEIVRMFDISESKTGIVRLYLKAEYHKVLSLSIQEYIYESKYFDLVFYFYSVCLLHKDKQSFAKALLKLYIGKTDKEIWDMIVKYEQKEKIKLNKVKEFYNELWLKDLKISSDYLVENDIHKFLEKVYLWLSSEKRSILMKYFKVWKISSDFEDIYKLFTLITNNYLRLNWDDSPNKQRIYKYVNSEKLAEEKLAIDSYIELYWTDKEPFYDKITELLNQPNVNKWDFWIYVKTCLINKYFPQVKQIFYWELINSFIGDRLKWNSLSWDINIDDESINSIEIYKKCDNFKKLIIQLQNNIWWPFLKPIVYRMITEHLKVDRKSFDKLQFIMCFITAKDYSEYRTIYRFFSDVKNIYWFYNRAFSNFYNYFNRIKLSLSLIIVFLILLTFLYHSAPVILFVCVLLMWLMYLFDFVIDDKVVKIEWNTWFKTFLIFWIIISWFTWFINIWKSLEDSEEIIKKINNFSNITFSDIVNDSNNQELWKYYADLLSKYKNKEIDWKQLLQWIMENKLDSLTGSELKKEIENIIEEVILTGDVSNNEIENPVENLEWTNDWILQQTDNITE